MTKNFIVPVILCGGAGTRLWPASRTNYPKQFLSLIDDDTLLQNTMKRALRISSADASRLVTVTVSSLKDRVITDLSEINPLATRHILCEPSARNTAAATAFAADYVAKTFGENAIMWILPSDHHVADEDVLKRAFSDALSAVENGHIVTFGITPTRPDTGYGYILPDSLNKTGKTCGVSAFVEKPDLETARAYLESGEYLWNSGMFAFTAKTILNAYKMHANEILAGIREATRLNSHFPNEDIYNGLEFDSFDKLIVEKSKNIAVVPCDPQWSDIGSWESLWDIRQKDENDNVMDGNTASHNSTGCLIQAKDRLVAVAGIDDIVVIETDDAILVAKRNDPESMKKLVESLKNAGIPEALGQSTPAPALHPWSMINTIPANEQDAGVLHKPAVPKKTSH